MWIIYDDECTPIGTITNNGINTTTIKRDLEREGFRVEFCEPYRIVTDEWED